MNVSIRQQLYILLIGFSLFTVVLGGLSYQTILKVNADLHDVADVQLPAVRLMTLADMMHDGLRSVVMEIIIQSGNNDKQSVESLLTELHEKSGDFRKYIENLEQLSLTPETMSAISNAKPEMDEYIELGFQVARIASTNGSNAAVVRIPTFMKSFKSLEIKMEVLGDLIQKESEKTRTNGAALAKKNAFVNIFGILAVVIVGLLVVHKLLGVINRFVESIEKSGKEVARVSEELSAVSSEVAQGSTTSVASIRETATLLEEIAAKVRSNSENAVVVQSMSTESQNSALSGNREIEKLVSAMNQIREYSKKMDEIISVIDDIAFQTNLLALNAAVESARAGDHGKGFAVVAEAVRSLAQRSSGAAKDISVMIRDSIHMIQDSNHLAAKSGATLKSIVTSVENVSRLNDEVSTASQDQSNRIVQLSAAMNALNEFSRKNAVSAEQVASSSNEMAHQAQYLQESVATLRKMI